MLRIMFILLLIGSLFTFMPVHQSQAPVVIAVPHDTTLNTSEIYAVMTAYAIGDGNSSSGFNGGTQYGVLNQMPKQMTAYVASPGPSSVTIYLGQSLIISNLPFNGNTSYTFVAPIFGVFNLTFIISNQLANVQKTIAYTVSIEEITTYIAYLQTVSHQVLTLLVSTYEGVQLGDLIGAFSFAMAWVIMCYGWIYMRDKRKGLRKAIGSGI